MAATAAGALVSGVQGRVIDQLQAQRIKPGQSLAKDGFDVIWPMHALAHAGKTFLNGLTLTCA